MFVYLKLKVMCDEDIHRLDIPMDHTLGVNVHETFTQLPKYMP